METDALYLEDSQSIRLKVSSWGSCTSCLQHWGLEHLNLDSYCMCLLEEECLAKAQGDMVGWSR